MKALFFSLFFLTSGLVSFQGVTFADYYSTQKIVAKSKKSHIKKCKALYPLVQTNLALISERNSQDTIDYFYCLTDYAMLLKIQTPSKQDEYYSNDLWDEKISSYTSLVAKINSSWVSQKSSFSEVIVEKKVLIKKEGNKKITEEFVVEVEPTNLKEAKEKCAKRGFKENSFDSLEQYLFTQCLEELGFAGQKVARSVRNVPIKKSIKESRIKKNQEKLALKRKQDEAKRKSAIEVKKKMDEKRILSEQEVAVKPEIQKAEVVPPVKSEIEVKVDVVKTNNKDVTYTKKTICKVDANGSKICMFEPTYKVQGATSVNKI